MGSDVIRFQKGDKVIPAFYQDFFHGPAPDIPNKGLGGSADGVFRKVGVFNEQGLVSMPQNLSYLEAATLPCAAVTAWNGLNGLEALKPGDCVLVQGTGGVSMFALQFAIAAGATVIATTSSDSKAAKLKDLGAHHVINYRQDANWGDRAKELSPHKRGCQRIIEIGGPATVKQSLQAIAPGGHIAMIGFITGLQKGEDEPSYLEAFAKSCVVRGIEVGNRGQLEEMIRAVEVNDIHPVIDPTEFGFDELPKALEHQFAQKHFGKVVVSI